MTELRDDLRRDVERDFASAAGMGDLLERWARRVERAEAEAERLSSELDASENNAMVVTRERDAARRELERFELARQRADLATREARREAERLRDGTESVGMLSFPWEREPAEGAGPQAATDGVRLDKLEWILRAGGNIHRTGTGADAWVCFSEREAGEHHLGRTLREALDAYVEEALAPDPIDEAEPFPGLTNIEVLTHLCERLRLAGSPEGMARHLDANGVRSIYASDAPASARDTLSEEMQRTGEYTMTTRDNLPPPSADPPTRAEFDALKYRLDLMEPLTPGRLPSAAEFDALAAKVDALRDLVLALEDNLAVIPPNNTKSLAARVRGR